MSKIRIVHLSDIHFGQEKDGTFRLQEDVREKLLDDCKLMREQLGAANGVVVSGDVAYAGKKEEYDRAGKWLDRLCDIVECDRRGVHTIPGNHDIDISKIDFVVQLLHEQLRNCAADDVDAVLAKIAGPESNNPPPGLISLFAKLAEYRDFAGRYQSDFESLQRPVSTKEILFPSGHRLRFLGLASVQVSDLKDEARKMVLGAQQYIFSEEPNVEYVVLTHHPVDWLKDKTAAMNHIRNRGRVIMAGHEHQPAFRKVEELGSEFVMIDAGAANPPGSEKRSPHCYNWVEFSLDESNAQYRMKVTVHPRIWVKEKAAFDADSSRLGGVATQTFTVKCPNYAAIVAPATPTAAEQSRAPIGISNSEPAAMPDDPRFAQLMYFFWRYLDWRQRYAVLAKVEILPQAVDRPMPQVVERNALQAASAANRLRDVWDEVMTHVPAEERKPNPFQ